jgi:group I intron endonuclease
MRQLILYIAKNIKRMVVYKTTNLLNGKIYVGKDESNSDWYLGSGFILKRAIEKYGKANFKKEILEYCDSRDLLEEREKYWIKELKATDPNIGYNVAEGGTGGNTFFGKTDEEMLEIKSKISNAGKGRVFSEEHRKKLSEAAKRRKGNKPCKFKGMKFEDYMDPTEALEARKKIKEARAKQIITKEAREKIGEFNRGKRLSEETKKKMSEAKKLYWKNKHWD